VALGFAGGADRLGRGTRGNLFTGRSSICAFVKLTASTAVNTGVPFSVDDASASPMRAQVVVGDLQFQDGGNVTPSPFFTIVIDTWYFIAVSNDGNADQRLRVWDVTNNTGPSTTFRATGSPRYLPWLWFGADGLGNNLVTMHLRAPRTWNALLTAGEFANERNSFTPVSQLSLLDSYYSFATNSAADRLTDLSFNKRDLFSIPTSGAGAWTTEADPPLNQTITVSQAALKLFSGDAVVGGGTPTRLLPAGPFEPELVRRVLYDYTYQRAATWDLQRAELEATTPTGVSATTLANAIGVATGSHTRGAAATTLDSATGVATGAHGVAGVSSTTLASSTSVSAGVHGVAGASGTTTASATSVSAGAHGVAGLSSTTLGAATGVSAGSTTVGSASSTTAAATVVSSGSVTDVATGVLSSNTESATVVAVGTAAATVTGSSSTTTQNATSVATGIDYGPWPLSEPIVVAPVTPFNVYVGGVGEVQAAALNQPITCIVKLEPVKATPQGEILADVQHENG
jgi:hypothetical protein